MKTVITHGYLIKTAECQSCFCKFIYNTEEDIEVEYEMNGVGREGDIKMRYVTCPECGKKIEVKYYAL